jgi:hypothetical protein
MISIGSVYKGPELKGAPLNVALMRAARVLSEVRGPLTLGSQPLVNAVFVVPGSLGRPEFDGLELGQYSKKDKAVVVQVAVPEKAVSEASDAFIVAGLRGANALAFEFFRQRGEVFPLRDAEQLVTEIAERLKAAEGSPR